MPDVPFSPSQSSCQSDSGQLSGCEPVCINVSRVYDSCSAKDCLSNLPVMFTQTNQSVVENACSVRINSANIITSTVNVEPVAFHRGFYAVDMVYYFAVTVEAYAAAGTIPSTLTGICTYGKRVVLYGGESCVKSFSSGEDVICDTSDTDCVCEYASSLPKATVKMSTPMALSAQLQPYSSSESASYCTSIPACVTDYIGGTLVQPSSQRISATIGVFTITGLERDVQIMVPSYDFCVPSKECTSTPDDPCEVFGKIEFPTDTFFPSSSRASAAGESDSSSPNFRCSCSN